MHTVQLQNARIYLNQRYLVEQIESGFFYIPEAAPWLAEYLHEIEYQENSTMPSHLSLSFVIGCAAGHPSFKVQALAAAVKSHSRMAAD